MLNFKPIRSMEVGVIQLARFDETDKLTSGQVN